MDSPVRLSSVCLTCLLSTHSIHDNDGVFDPGFVPADKPAPHFSRPPIQANKKMKDKGLRKVRRLSGYVGDFDPWLPIMRGRFRKY